MRFLHTADWHVGKKLAGYDLLSDQEIIFQEILHIAKEEKVDGVVIAGDLYDRTMPASESVAFLNQLLYQWNIVEKLPLFVVSGNHDSAIRLGTGSPWFLQDNFYLQTEFSKSLTPIEFLDTQFYLVPFFDLFDLNQLFPKENFTSLQVGFDFLVAVLKKTFKKDKKQVFVGHFFAQGGKKSDSETKLEVGGLQGISTKSLEDFTYVALGHLHSPSALKHPTIRYSGAPLAFSLPEAGEKKGVVLVDTKENLQQFIPLHPVRKVISLTGSFQDLLEKPEFLAFKKDYVGIHLTDEGVIPNVLQRLKDYYPYILELTRNHTSSSVASQPITLQKSPLAIFETFFQDVTEKDLNPQQKKILEKSFTQLLKEED